MREHFIALLIIFNEVINKVIPKKVRNADKVLYLDAFLGIYCKLVWPCDSDFKKV